LSSVIFEIRAKKKKKGKHWRFTPIILATWEAEIKRIAVEPSLCKQFKRPHLQNNQKSG
jgi:hypothetical protein